MKPEGTACERRDLLAKPRSAMALFWLPAIAMVVTGNSRFSGEWRAIVWTVALAVMGTGCVLNAKRCGRIHCYLTGPFFLLMAVVTALYGIGVVPLGQHGWNLVGLVVLVGAIALCCLPELMFGRYRRREAGNGNRR